MKSVPPGWQVRPLAELATLGSGGTPQAKNPDYYDGDIPWAIIGDLNDDVVHKTKQSITAQGLHRSSAKVVPAGTIMLAMYGSIGKLGITAGPMATNQAIATIQPSAGIDERYVFYYLLSQRRELDRRGMGATQRNISQTVLNPWPVLFPTSINEQRRIVDLLEDHLSRLDAASASLRDSLYRADAMVASSLASQVTLSGELWPCSTVGQQADVVQYGSGAKCGTHDTEDDVPVLRMGNLKEGALVWNSLKYLPSDHADFPKLLLTPGDLLFNRTNSAEHVGKSAVFNSEWRASFASYLIRVRFGPNVTPEWASMVINSPMGRKHVASVVSQQVGQANVNGTKLKAFPLPIPPREEQSRLVSRHAEVVENRQRLRNGVSAALDRETGLRRSLLAAAFSGRLTGESIDHEEATP